MKIYVDGKSIECEEIRISVSVSGIHNITEDSTLDLIFTHEGLIADLNEVTDRCTGSSIEVTETFSNTYEELLETLFNY